MNTFVNVYRAVSASQVITFDETETEPPGITNKVLVSRRLANNLVLIGSGSTVLWKWNGLDTSQFETTPAIAQGISGTLEVISSSFSPTSKSLLLSGAAGSTAAGDHIVFLATASLPTTRYVLEMSIRSVADSAGTSYGGPVVLAFGTGSTFHGVGSFQVNETTATIAAPLWQTGALDDTYTAVVDESQDNPQFVTVNTRGGETISGSYAFTVQTRTRSSNTSWYSRIYSSTRWNPLISTWATSSIGRFGIGLRCDAATTDPKIIIDHMLIRTEEYVI
jgi:hypothetical protein